jgi:hypothetical protein
MEYIKKETFKAVQYKGDNIDEIKKILNRYKITGKLSKDNYSNSYKLFCTLNTFGLDYTFADHNRDNECSNWTLEEGNWVLVSNKNNYCAIYTDEEFKDIFSTITDSE